MNRTVDLHVHCYGKVMTAGPFKIIVDISNDHVQWYI